MNSVSLGDLAQAQFLRRSSAASEQRLVRLTEELSSGRRADLAAASGGDYKLLSGIERSLGILASYKTATDEAALIGTGVQTALATVQGLSEDAGNAFVSAGTLGTGAVVDSAATTARQQLDAAVSALNANIGDRYLFSGAATDQRPLAGSDAILSALRTATAGLTSASSTLTAVRDWFDAPAGGGGFRDLAYGGTDAAGGPIPIGEGEGASFAVTAASPEIRRAIEGLALGALVAEGALAGDIPGRAQVLRHAGETLLSTGTTLSELRGQVGSVEAAIESAATRNQAEATALDIARNRIVAADPYETASALEEARGQLELIYTLTARLANMSLLEYLR